MLKVLIVDDHAVVRKGLAEIVEAALAGARVEMAANGLEALQACGRFRFDLILLDISMPGMGGLEVLKEIARDAKRNVLIMTMFEEDEFALRAIKAGALGFISKSASAEEISRAIVYVARGKRYLSDSLTERLVDCLAIGPKAGTLECLSEREFQIFRMLREGQSIKEISAQLGVGAKTIYTHRERIRIKLKVRSDREFITGFPDL